MPRLRDSCLPFRSQRYKLTRALSSPSAPPTASLLQKLAASAPTPSETWLPHPYLEQFWVSSEGRFLLWSLRWVHISAPKHHLRAIRVHRRAIWVRDHLRRQLFHAATLVAETHVSLRPSPSHRIRYRNHHPRDIRAANLFWQKDAHHGARYGKVPGR